MKIKRAIGIYMGSSSLCAVQMVRTGKTFCIEKVFDVQIRRSTDSPVEALKTMKSKHGFSRHAAVAVSMPSEAVFFRRLETDHAGLRQICNSGSFTSEHDFPIDPNDMVAQPCSYRRMTPDRYSVLAAATTKESLQESLDSLLGAKMRPDLIDTTVSAIYSTVAHNHPEIRGGVALIVHVAKSRLTLAAVQDGGIVMVRNLPIDDFSGDACSADPKPIVQLLSIEATVIWRKLFETEFDPTTRLYLVTGNDSTALAAAIQEYLKCPTIAVNPCARIMLKRPYRVTPDICIAEGLALRVLAPDEAVGANFLAGVNAGVRPAFNVKKKVATCALLVVAIVIVSLLGLFTRRVHLESEYAGVENAIEDIFRRTLPEEKNVVNPLAQLDQKLQTLRRDYASSGYVCDARPLEILSAIGVSTPSDMKISLDDALMTAESVLLTGTSESFDSVYKWQQELSDAVQFSTVDVRDVRRESDSTRVRFVVLASFSTERSI